ncbi:MULTISPECIES: ATP-binding protein [Nostoc]|uniref:DNA binding domain-containing protein n=2 Tax=Nostoc TaxID=1177 RepID=A0ABR8ID51_9NOSO|nr:MULTISPECIES: RNA-binding domain-containing protein [Nostoc]MBD2560251.1 putative DNA binding domain-containing protein [Nostoc linckia FACHB-391]MBD2648767.1 putative DNA binding domain-containing protein [Nostoc foliaceum FACHB-393]MBN3890549.1 putative DNA binding domain-containing protein [Nostoc sp. JL31]
MDTVHLKSILLALTSLPHETEWVEFKVNNSSPEDIGEYLSALSNSATLHGKNTAYIVWGVDDISHDILGTKFKPRLEKIGNQELENWLATQLSPRINFKIYEFTFEEKNIVFFEIPKANHVPVRFKGVEYIRVGSYKQLLKDFLEKERELWALFSLEPFEKSIALESLAADEVITNLNYPAYFDLTKQSLPDNRDGIIQRLISERLIVQRTGNIFDVTNLGGILFAKDLRNFERLSRKAIRVVIYKGKNRVESQREQTGIKGYATDFEGMLGFINDQLPKNEQIGQAFRREQRMYPELAIRELVANAIIHQDFNISGTGPLIEIFTDRIEITNPGVPLIDTMRFIDQPPRSRNEDLAAFMRRINICEERGSGIDKVILMVELFQLPAPEFQVTTNHTKVTLFAYKKLADMDKADRVRACYQHACLRYVSNDRMTNSSLRERFSIKDENYSMASRIISDTIDTGLIKPYDPENMSRKHAKYVPFWA